MALAKPRGTGEILREGAARAPTAHAAVPGLERTGQLRLRHQEEEAKERESSYRFGRYISNTLSCRTQNQIKKKNGQSVCAELICDVGAHGSTLGICRSLSNRRRAYVRATLFGGGWGACAEWVGVASVVAYLRLRLLGARRRDDSTRRRRQVLSLSV